MLVECKDLRDRFLIFEDRMEAGKILAEFIKDEGLAFDTVLSIPNGGVAVGYEFSIELGVPLSLAVVRKITYPWTTEAGFGAVSWLEDITVDERDKASLSEGEYLRCLEKAKESVQRRAELFKAFLPKALNGLRVSIIDDGLATGYTMVAAVKAARKLGAREITVAVPTSSISAAYFVLEYVDSLVVLNIRTWLPYAVADAYRNWADITESEVLTMLNCLREKGLA